MKAFSGVFSRLTGKGKIALYRAESPRDEATAEQPDHGSYFDLPQSLFDLSCTEIRKIFGTLFDKATKDRLDHGALLKHCSAIVQSPPSPSFAAAPQRVSPVVSLLVVGFHHNRGPVVEFIAPSADDVDEQFSTDLQEATPWLSFLCLPDASHNCEADSVSFILYLENNGGSRLYGTSCFRRIDSEVLEYKESTVTRNCVQKAVCLLTGVPVLGRFDRKLSDITYEFFAQRDFRNTETLSNFQQQVAMALSGNSTPQTIRPGLLEWDLPPFINQIRAKDLLVLVKALLLELRIAVHSTSARRASSAVLVLISMIPGLFPGDESVASLGGRLPLYSPPDCLICPYLSLQLSRSFQGKRAYVFGGTNPMLIDRLLPDIVVWVDRGTVEIFTKAVIPLLTLTDTERRLVRKGLQHLSDDVTPRISPEKALTKSSTTRGGGLLGSAGWTTNRGETVTSELVTPRLPRGFSPTNLVGAGADTTAKRIPSVLDYESCESIDREIFEKTPLGAEDANQTDCTSAADIAVNDIAGAAISTSSDPTEATREQIFAYLNVLARLIAFAAGPRRDIRLLRVLIEEKALGLKDFNIDFLEGWSKTAALQEWLSLHTFPTIPKFTLPPKCGWACFEYDNGDHYYGEFLKGLRHGRGCYFGRGGMVYVGGWALDKRHGRGALAVKANKVLYEGEWEKDMRSGHGSMLSQREFYCGEWKNNKFEGKGSFVDSQGNKYQGSFQAGQLHGPGTLIRAGGELSVGSWVNAKLFGVGRRVFKDGRIYVGRFYSNFPDGDGIMVFPDGTQFEGDWKAGLRDGPGTLFVPATSFLAAYDEIEYWSSTDEIQPPPGKDPNEWDRFLRSIQQTWEAVDRHAYFVKSVKLSPSLILPEVIIEGHWKDDLPVCDNTHIWNIIFPTGERYTGTLQGSNIPTTETPPTIVLPKVPSVITMGASPSSSTTADSPGVGVTALWGRLKLELRSRRMAADDYNSQRPISPPKEGSLLVVTGLDDKTPPSATDYQVTMSFTGILPHGKGLEKTKEGIYEGEYVEGMRFGVGEMVYNDGSRHRGDWAYGQAHGGGTRVSADGRASVGHFAAGELKITTAQLQARALATEDVGSSEVRLPEKPTPQELEDKQELWSPSLPFLIWPLDKCPYIADSRVSDFASQCFRFYY